jgi:multidrug efflux pump subunit AcrB
MTRLSDFVIDRRRWIIVAWVLLTVVGVFVTGRLSDRWFPEPLGKLLLVRQPTPLSESQS